MKMSNDAKTKVQWALLVGTLCLSGIGSYTTFTGERARLIEVLMQTRNRMDVVEAILNSRTDAIQKVQVDLAEIRNDVSWLKKYLQEQKEREERKAK
mgnify:CR=1 FL=1